MTLDTNVCFITTYSIGVQSFNNKGPFPVMCAGSRAARGKITVVGITDCLNYCALFIVYIIYNVAIIA